MAELYECRPEVVERPPQPHTDVGGQKLLKTPLLAPVAPHIEDEPEAVANQDPADLLKPRQVPRANCWRAASVHRMFVLTLNAGWHIRRLCLALGRLFRAFLGGLGL